MKTIIAYIPVIHQGYINFFSNNKPDIIYVLGKTITKEFRPLQKDIRALDPEQIVTTVLALKLAKKSVVIELDQIEKLQLDQVIMPDELVSRTIASRYFSKDKVKFDQVFLRWDSQKSLSPNQVEVDETVTQSVAKKKLINLVKNETEKSADWWRQVGAMIVKEGEILLSGYNHHLPSEQQPYIDGDPRADFHKGEHIDKSTAMHAEAGLIAQAAKEGIKLEGTSLYVTTFPCPNCAKLIAYSGIKELYFSDGYGVLDGERVLRDKKVKIVRVK